MDEFFEIRLVEKSLERCLTKEGFLAQFYFELCNIHPTPYYHLGGPVLDEYKENLHRILKCLIDFGNGQKKSICAQKTMEIGLSPETVAYWEQALIIAITANDEKLDQETSGAWRSLIKEGLEFLLAQKKLKKAA